MRARLPVLAATMAAAACTGVAHGAGGAVIFTIAGAGKGAFAGDGKPATSARLNGPAGLLDTGGGEILVADTINQRIRRIDARGYIHTLAGSGARGSADGPPLAAKFQDPTGLALGGPGVLVADSANSQVRAVALPSGSVETIAGTGESGFSGDGGPARSALLDEPSGIAVAGDTIFVADTANNRIRAIDGAGTIRTIAGTGAAGFSGDGGPATDARLNRPAGLAIGAAGLLVADSGNSRIRAIRPDGTIATVAGTGTAGSSGDGGPATAAALNAPLDVAARGNELFIAETGGNRVRWVDAAGRIATLAGDGAARFGGDGGAPAAARLNSPSAVELGTGGDDLLIADSDDNRVRYIAIPGASDANLLGLAVPRASLVAPLRTITRTIAGHELRSRALADVRIRYVLSRAATVSLTVRTERGRKVATFRRPGAPGAAAVSLPARLRAGRKRLVKGFYSVTLTAKDALGRVAINRIELIVR